MRLEGKTAVITGAGSGMGLAIATRFAAEGARVVAGDWNGARLDAAVAAIRERGGTIVGAQGNIADQATAEGLLDLAIGTHGRLDILINNAGGNIRSPLTEYKTADFQSIVNTHLTAAFVLAREAAKTMVKQRHGRIISTSSIMGRVARPTIPAYVAAKAALDSLTRGMAVELGPQGVTVNAIAPGYFITEINTPLLANKEFTAMIERRTPVGRWGQPDELGAAAVFLASDEAGYVNGHTLVVDGGITIAL